MERLTYFENGHWRLDFNGCQYRAGFVDRLADYEDTGLSPESVEALKLSMMGKAVSEITEFNGLPIDRLRELALADKEGRVIITDALPADDKRDGLRQKYRVYKAKDNAPVEGCFVLRPGKDLAARIALEAYAKATENKALSEDILAALGDFGRVVVLPDKIETVVQPVQVSTDDLARFQGNAQANDVGHCKTCKHCHEERGNFCDYHAASVCPNWFCWGWEWKGGDA